MYVHVQGNDNRQGAWQTSSADNALADLLCPRAPSIRCIVYQRRCLENAPPPAPADGEFPPPPAFHPIKRSLGYLV